MRSTRTPCCSPLCGIWSPRPPSPEWVGLSIKGSIISKAFEEFLFRLHCNFDWGGEENHHGQLTKDSVQEMNAISWKAKGCSGGLWKTSNPKKINKQHNTIGRIKSVSNTNLLKKQEKSPAVIIHVNEGGSVDEEHEPGLQRILGSILKLF